MSALARAFADFTLAYADAQRVTQSAYDTLLRDICWFAGARYGGVQETPAGRWLVLTEHETGSTGYVPLDATFTTRAVCAKVTEIRRRFRPCATAS